MSEEKEEGANTIEEVDKPLDERVAVPTSIDVTDDQISIGPTSFDVTDEQISMEETPVIEPQEEKPQEQKRGIGQVQMESSISKRKQKRRITSYLSNISKQVEKHGNQINKLTVMIQSLQKQKQSKSIVGAGVDKLQSQSIKQIKSQISQLQKQVARIQNDIRRIGTPSIVSTKTKSNSKSKKPSTSTTKPRPKKSKLFKTTKVKKGRKSR